MPDVFRLCLELRLVEIFFKKWVFANLHHSAFTFHLHAFGWQIYVKLGIVLIWVCCWKLAVCLCWVLKTLEVVDILFCQSLHQKILQKTSSAAESLYCRELGLYSCLHEILLHSGLAIRLHAWWSIGNDKFDKNMRLGFGLRWLCEFAGQGCWSLRA